MMHTTPITQRLELLELSVERLLSAVKELVHLHHHLPERITMALKPEVQAAVDSVKAAIVSETSEIKTQIQALIDAINAGQDTAETVAALNELASNIGAISDNVMPTP